MVGTTVVCTGISCTERRSYLDALCHQPKDRRRGHEIEWIDVGEIMISVGRAHTRLNVTEHTILDLPESTLETVRELAFEEILRKKSRSTADIYIVATHALFHWKGALVAGWSPAMIGIMLPDYFITIWEDVSIVWDRMNNDPRWAGIGLSEVAMWREEEIFFTAMMADVVEGKHYLIARDHPVETLCDLICSDRKRVYRSYPITEVAKYDEVRGEADELRDEMQKHMVVFDPGTVKDAEFAFWLNTCLERFEERLNAKRADVTQRLDAACGALKPDEKAQLVESLELTTEEKRQIIEQVCKKIEDAATGREKSNDPAADEESKPPGTQQRLRVFRQVALELSVRAIKNLVIQLGQQTVANDYRLVRQSDAVVAFWPLLPNGKKPLSFGVICEMFYGLASQKQVYAIWLPETRPSPFLYSISTRCFEPPHPQRKFFDSQNVSGTIYHQRGAGNR